jgi:hypothetical protein
MMRIMALIAPALLLAACGGSGESEIASGTVTDADGKSVDYSVTQSGDGDDGKVTIKTSEGEMQFGSGAGNAKMPDGFTLYPGAKLTGGMNSAAEGKTATMANFEVAGKGADVIAHYRKQAEAQGMKIMGEMSSPGNIILTAQQDKPAKRSVQVTAAESDGKVVGTIMAQTGG